MAHEKSHYLGIALAGLFMAAMAIAGCQKPVQMQFPEPVPTVRYRETTGTSNVPTGQLTGSVVWLGQRPVSEPIRGLIDTAKGATWDEVPNPFEPKVQRDGSVAGVVVQVLNPPAEITQTWPHNVLTECRLVKDELEFNGQSSPAFAKVGSELTLRSDVKYSQIRARGASFFTRSFDTIDTQHQVMLDQPGCVELTRPNGQFWIHAHIWVCDHPYFVKTDDKGAFDLGQLPPGEYDIRASIPNWQIVGRDRDPETGRVMQLHRGPDIIVTERVKIEAGQQAKLTLKLSVPTKNAPQD